MFKRGISADGTFLVKQDTGLNFSVLHVAGLIREKIGPEGSLRAQRPDPDLFTQFFRIIVPVAESKVAGRIESGEKIGIGPENMIAVIGAIIVLNIIGNVSPIFQNGPGRLHPVVPDVMVARENVFQIRSCIGSCGRPLIL